jgi:hypothetical protein
MATLTERSKVIPELGATAAIGLLAGVVVSLATYALSNSDIGGPGWSLHGNGALIVIFALGPALLGAGWVWLARRSVSSAVIAGAAVLAIELLFGFGPIMLGPTPTLSFALIVAAPLLAALAGYLLAGSERATGRVPGIVTLLIAALLSLGVQGLAYVLVAVLVPVVLATPVLVPRWSGRLLTDCLVLLLAMLVGGFGSQSLLHL